MPTDYRWEMLDALEELLGVVDHPDKLTDEDKELRIAKARDAVARGQREKKVEMERFI